MFHSPVMSKLDFLVLLAGLDYALNHVKKAIKHRTKQLIKQIILLKIVVEI